MHRLRLVGVGGFCLALAFALATPGAHTLPSQATSATGWWQARGRLDLAARARTVRRAANAAAQQVPPKEHKLGDFLERQRLFEQETFGGNGRTCQTCHSTATGTVSPEDAQRRFAADTLDPLFVHDGSDDDNGDGLPDGVHFTRMLANATVLMRIRLHDNVEVKDHPEIREVTVPRGIPTTLNTPGLDPVLMLDGRQPTLQEQALGAITQHAQATRVVSARELDLIAAFQKTRAFFSSPRVQAFFDGGHPPQLPQGRTASERRGRVFFEDLPPDPPNFKPGICANCHSGPLLNATNQFLPLAVPPGTRFQSVLVSEFNAANNPVTAYVFKNQQHVPGGILEVPPTPDAGRALISGIADDFFPFPPGSFDHLNAFKISPLWGVSRTAPYFHDNSAKTLEDVAEHYRQFFLIVTDLDGPGGPLEPLVQLTDQDLKDMVAYMRLLH